MVGTREIGFPLPTGVELRPDDVLIPSVSLGGAHRYRESVLMHGGERIVLWRISANGDRRLAMRHIADLATEAGRFKQGDAGALKVGGIGLGGYDLFFNSGRKLHPIRETTPLARVARENGLWLADGARYKQVIEYATVSELIRSGVIDIRGKRFAQVAYVDRPGMAQALLEGGGLPSFGDLPFGLKVGGIVRSMFWARMLARTMTPVVAWLPVAWTYPTGEKQTQYRPSHPGFWDEAAVICGDFHYIRRHLTTQDRGRRKTVITNTVTEADRGWLKDMGIWRIITTTPPMGEEGHTFSPATNLVEALLCYVAGQTPENITDAQLLQAAKYLSLKPRIEELF